MLGNFPHRRENLAVLTALQRNRSPVMATIATPCHGKHLAPLACMTRHPELLSSTNSDMEGPVLPANVSIPTWSTHEWVREVSLNQLCAFDRIIVTTGNHRYEIVVTSAATADVLVRGGDVFPEFTRARLAGGLLGLSCLKTRCITVGLRLEFAVPPGRRIITTRVRSISVVVPSVV
jgi:hypothetical protein